MEEREKGITPSWGVRTNNIAVKEVNDQFYSEQQSIGHLNKTDDGHTN